MRLFKKEKAQFGAEDVKATQDVVQSITAALKSGAEQQDIAAKRLGALTKSMEREAGLRESEIKLTREREALTKELNQRTDRLEELAGKQQRLQDQLAEANGLLSSQSNKNRELKNAVEELTVRLDEKTKSSDASLAALRDLRLDFHAAKERLVAANSQLQSVEYEQTSQKNLYDDRLKRRADEILALKTQIEQLSTQLRIKDTMDSHFDEETSGLRQALETERERNRGRFFY